MSSYISESRDPYHDHKTPGNAHAKSNVVTVIDTRDVIQSSIYNYHLINKGTNQAAY